MLVAFKATPSFCQETVGLGSPSEAQTNVILLPTNVVILAPIVVVYSPVVSNRTEDSLVVMVGALGSVEYQ